MHWMNLFVLQSCRNLRHCNSHFFEKLWTKGIDGMQYVDNTAAVSANAKLLAKLTFFLCKPCRFRNLFDMTWLSRLMY